MSDFAIGHVTDPKEGPMDGVHAERIEDEL